MSLGDALRRRWKWVAGVVAVVLLVTVVGPFVYINVIQDDAPDRLSLSSGTTTTTLGGEEVAPDPGDGDDGGSSAVDPASLDGRWTVAAGSIVGYRVEEVLFGQNTEAAGRTEGVTGDLQLDGTRVEDARFVADLTTVTSDEERRDGQFHGRIMDTATFPTATFDLTEPFDVETIPDDLVQVSAAATGDLTIRDVTRSVTFDVVAQRNGDTIEINGTIPVVFADYGIPDASFGPASVEDHGEIEFLLVLERAEPGS